MSEINIKVPGKLYIAGEYAVVESGYSAIITTVDLFIHLKLKETNNSFGYIYSKKFTETPVRWFRKKDEITLTKETPALKYVLSALHITEKYVKALGIPLKMYNIDIQSELENNTEKFGLGSSGAVTVAVVKALNKLYKMNLSKSMIYKLSVLAQLKLGANSSFGDLAASTYTGCIKYTNFDREFIKDNLIFKSIKTLVEMPWPKLEIKRITIPKSVQFLVGWTATPSSSFGLVGSVQVKKERHLKQYQQFLKESYSSVEQLTEALERENNEQIARAILKNRNALLLLGRQLNVLIETPILKQLIDIAIHYGGAAKVSGAGGGDSGIAFVFDHLAISKIKNEWKKIGVVPLSISIYKNE